MNVPFDSIADRGRKGSFNFHNRSLPPIFGGLQMRDRILRRCLVEDGKAIRFKSYSLLSIADSEKLILTGLLL